MARGDGGLERLGEAARRIGVARQRLDHAQRPLRHAAADVAALAGDDLVERVAHAQILCRVASAWAALPLSIDWMASAAPCFRSDGLARDHQRRRAVQHDDVAEGVLLAAQHGSDGLGVVRGVAALELGQRGAFHADVLRRDLDLAHLAVLERGGPALGRGGELVHAVLAVHDQRALEPELAQRLGHRLQPAAVEHADELALHRGGVRHRAQQVEDGARRARARRAGRRRCAWRRDGAAPSGSRSRLRPAPARASRSAIPGRCPAPTARRPRRTWR